MTDGARGTGGRPLVDVLPALARGGVEMIVLRERDPDVREFERWVRVLEPARSRGLKLLVSRRLDLARAFDLEGVHLARDAVEVRTARAWLGPRALIGYSAHARDEALEVEQAGASYVTLSPIYSTESKPGIAGRGPDWLRESSTGLRVPVLALGGIDVARVGEVIDAGARGIAAVSALGAAKDVEVSARAFRAALFEAGAGALGEVNE